MYFDLARLATTQYYLDPNPGGDFILGYFLLIFFIALCFVGSLTQPFIAKNKYLRKSFKNQLWKFYILGSLGVILVLSRFAAVPGFSMRLWLYIVLALTLIAGATTFCNVRARYQKRMKSVEREKKKKRMK